MESARETLALSFDRHGFQSAARGFRNGSADPMLLAILDAMRAYREVGVTMLEEAITDALKCTPRIGVKYNGFNGQIYRNVIEYDCGNPWAILRAALATDPAGEPSEGGE